MKKQKRYDVFISYRRGSGLYMAKNIAHALEKRGLRVFFDYDSIENGDFNNQIYTAIQEVKDFILVLSESALDDCCSENDWVRKEVVFAKKHNKNIILAQDEKRFVEWPLLPDDMKFLTTIDWTPVNPKLFEGSLNLICDRLRSSMPTFLSKTFSVVEDYKLLFSIIGVILVGILVYVFYPLKLVYMESEEEEYRALLPKAFCHDVLDEYESLFDERFGEIEILYAFIGADGSGFIVMEEDVEQSFSSYLNRVGLNIDFDEYLENLDMEKYANSVVTSLTGEGFFNFKTTYKIIDLYEVPFITYEGANDYIYIRTIRYNIEDDVFRNFTMTLSKKSKNFVERNRYFRAFEKMVESFEEMD